MKNTLLFACFFLLHTAIFAQQFYIPLKDASGFNTDIYQDSLEAAAERLVAAFPDSTYRDSFKVFDGGFYLHQEVTEGGYPEAFEQMMVTAGEMSPYYLLFGKQTDKTGIYTKFWVEVKLPTTRRFSCMTNLQRTVYEIRVQKKVEDTYEALKKSHIAYDGAETAGMAELTKIVEEIIECCVAKGEANRMTGCDGCSDEVVDTYFQLQGFKKINLNLSNASFANVKSGLIIDYSFSKILVGSQLNYVGNHLSTFISNFNKWFSVNLLVTSSQSLCIDSIVGTNLDLFKTQEDFLCQINLPSGQGIKPSDIKITWNKANSRIKDPETAQLMIGIMYCNINNALGVSNESCYVFDCDYAVGTGLAWGLISSKEIIDTLNEIDVVNTWNGPFLLTGRLVAAYNYRHPFTEMGHRPPEDMRSETNGDCTGVKYNCMTEEVIYIGEQGVPFVDPITESERKNWMHKLIDFMSKGTLKAVGEYFVDKFLSKQGNLQNEDQYKAEAMFSDELSNVARQTPNMRNFMRKFGERFNQVLENHNGNIDLLKSGEVNLTGVLRPKFNSKADRCNGLGILVNDTEQTQVWYDKNFIIDLSTGEWSADFFFVITDHFGLGHDDVIKFQHYPVAGNGFASWWTLQHRDGYRPFLTKITMYAKLKGKIKPQ